jgi:hypothetical protein
MPCNTLPNLNRRQNSDLTTAIRNNNVRPGH